MATEKQPLRLRATAINLPSVNIGNRKIRYMVVLPSKIHSRCRTTLFLGADVLHNCGNFDLKNLGRTHGRYAEDGLACKVHLPKGYQIKGIRGVGDKVWFYSVQGLFRVAFNFYSKIELKFMLGKMVGLWMEAADETLLQANLLIKDIQDMVTDDIIFENIQVFDSQRCSKGSTIEMNRDCDSLPCSNEVILESDASNFDKGESGGGILSGEDSRQRESELSSNFEIAGFIRPQCKSPVLKKAYGSIYNISNPENTVKEREKDFHLENSIENAVSRLLQVFKDEQSCTLIASYIESFIDLLIDEETNISEQQSTSFPIKLIKDYMDAKCNKMTELPLDHELAIHIISSWVGDRFYLFKDIIKHNINSFKQTYIDSITELPSPEEIVRTVYPSAMYSLIYLWIRGTGEDVLDGPDNVEDAKRIRSICLLILELLNGSPITGLGHWIFSVI